MGEMFSFKAHIFIMRNSRRINEEPTLRNLPISSMELVQTEVGGTLIKLLIEVCSLKKILNFI